MGRPRPLQCSAWSFGPAFRSRDAAPCVLSARSRTPCEQGLFVTSRPGMLEGRARLLALATVAREPSLTCGSFFSSPCAENGTAPAPAGLVSHASAPVY